MMNNHTVNPLHIVFAGGGTGGHLFPGLAVADQLVERVPRVQIAFVGRGSQFERQHVAAAGFEHLALPCRPFPKGPREAFSFVSENLAGYLAAGRVLDQQRVAVVVGLGGYASVPMAWAASRRRVPLVLLEQNVIPGRATRWLARSAELVCVAWAPTRSALRCRCPVRVTGNPIRWAESGQSPSARLPQHRLLILGGSAGARSLNENVPRALYKVRTKLTGWQIVHQSGEADFEATGELYRKLDLEATVAPFLADVPGVLAATDLAVCRSGGSTLAELAAAGVPAVLMPYPHATNDHQHKNAQMFTRAGGAVMLDGRELPGRLDDHLADAISLLLGDPDRRSRMSGTMRRFARPGAAAEVADSVLQLAGQFAHTVPAAA